MKYLVTVYAYSDEIDPLPYEEWAQNDRELNRIVNRITPHMTGQDVLIVTDLESGDRKREKVTA